MENLIEKPVAKIKNQIEFWFLKYYNKSRKDFDGTEPFTFFDLMDENYQNKLLNQLILDKLELPVLILKISESEFIVNTTKKFTRINESSIDRIDYTEFECHKGYKSIAVISTPTGKIADVKTEGLIYDFGLRKRNGEIIYWKIPTGESGFAFWNITKKCALIGRKYKVTE